MISKRLWIALLAVTSVMVGLLCGLVLAIGTVLVSFCVAHFTGRGEIVWVGFWMVAMALMPVGLAIGGICTAIWLKRQQNRPWRTALRIIGICVAIYCVPFVVDALVGWFAR